MIKQLKQSLRNFSNPVKAKILQGFFKTGKGEYGEGDRFLGVVVPDVRKVVKMYWQKISLSDVEKFIHS